MTFIVGLLFLMAPVVLKDVHVEVGDGTTLPKTNVVWDAGKVVAISATVPAGATIIDGRGKVLAPGFIEIYSQLGLTEVSLEDSTNDHELKDGPWTPGFRAADGFNDSSIRFAISREEGVTSAVVAPAGGVLYGTGYLFHLTGAVTARPDRNLPVAMFGSVAESAAASVGGSRGAVWLGLRRLVDDARFYKANRQAVDRRQTRDLMLLPLHLEAILPVLEGKLPLVLFAHRASDILSAVEWAKGEKVRLVIAGATEAWRVADTLAAAQIPVVLRPSEQMPYGFEGLAARDDAATVLHEHRVKVVITASDFDQNVRRLRQEAGFAVSHGLPHAEAVRAITSAVPLALGIAEPSGRVAVGSRADLVLWSGDPLEIQSVVERLWIGGDEQSLDNRQRALVRRYSADSPPASR